MSNEQLNFGGVGFADPEFRENPYETVNTPTGQWRLIRRGLETSMDGFDFDQAEHDLAANDRTVVMERVAPREYDDDPATEPLDLAAISIYGSGKHAVRESVELDEPTTQFRVQPTRPGGRHRLEDRVMERSAPPVEALPTPQLTRRRRAITAFLTAAGITAGMLTGNAAGSYDPAPRVEVTHSYDKYDNSPYTPADFGKMAPNRRETVLQPAQAPVVPHVTPKVKSPGATERGIQPPVAKEEVEAKAPQPQAAPAEASAVPAAPPAEAGVAAPQVAPAPPEAPAKPKAAICNTNNKEAFDFLVSQGLTPNGAMAVMGNVWSEGGRDKSGNLVLNRKQGAGIQTQPGPVANVGFGPFQYTSPDRQQKLREYAAAQPAPHNNVASLRAQFGFAVTEMKRMPELWRQLTTPGAGSVRTLISSFLRIFERPKHDNSGVRADVAERDIALMDC